RINSALLGKVLTIALLDDNRRELRLVVRDVLLGAGQERVERNAVRLFESRGGWTGGGTVSLHPSLDVPRRQIDGAERGDLRRRPLAVDAKFFRGISCRGLQPNQIHVRGAVRDALNAFRQLPPRQELDGGVGVVRRTV